MDFNTARQHLEELISRQADELRRYAESEKPSQKAVDIRTQQLNVMIEFLNAATTAKNTLEWELLQAQMQYQDLHAHTTKLVLLTDLHGINPTMITHYTETQLRRMRADGLLILPGRRWHEHDYDREDHQATEYYLSVQQHLNQPRHGKN